MSEVRECYGGEKSKSILDMFMHDCKPAQIYT
jgi:hypothetical protein